MIVDATHVEHVASAALTDICGAVVVQPQDRGTAAGVLLALSPVLESAPDAIVALTPADHGVADFVRFRQAITHAADYARTHSAIVLFGVEPTAAHQDYGWISLTSEKVLAPFRQVRSFVEKPNADFAARLLRRGAIWNSMVLVAPASALRNLYVQLLPELAKLFARALDLPPSRRAGLLSSIYPRLPAHDFSRHVLGRAKGLSAYVLPASVGWSDLGTPERLHSWQQALTRPPVITAA